MENYSKLTDKIIMYLNEKNYQSVIDTLTEAVLTKNKNEIFYLGKGNAYYYLREYDNAILHYEMAIQVNPSYGDAYNKLGNVYCELMEYEKAIPCYERTIELYPKKIWGYYNLAMVYANMHEYAKAIELYTKVISMDSKNDAAFYNRGKTYFDFKQYENALADFKQKIKLTKQSPDYFTVTAKEYITAIEKIIRNTGIQSIIELIISIRDILKCNDKEVVHYTGMATGKSLILENNPFRLHEATFINSNTEGEELVQFLSLNMLEQNSNSAKSIKLFNPAGLPFIGSFVPVHKEHDMNLWKMCGKEVNEEPKGCAITLRRQKLIDALNEKLLAGSDDNLAACNLDEFNLYRVAYHKEVNGTSTFMIPGAADHVNIQLNKLLNELKISIANFFNNPENNTSDRNYIKERLNIIIFLFKCTGCEYEQELRMTVRGRRFEPIVDLAYTPPRVYIELVPLNGIISKITLGPEVAHVNELASAMSYHFKKQDGSTKTSIFISH